MIAARITEPPVGASTCASGSQVCTGHIGTFTANAARNATNTSFCAVSPSGSACRSSTANEPASEYRYSSATSISTEPRKV